MRAPAAASAATVGPPAPPDPGGAGGKRIAVLDVLRGLGLLGIVQINIQSFTWGSVDPLAYLTQPAGAAESALYFVQAAFIQGKFYPIFAFLFGAGLVLQAAHLRARGAGRGRMRRRLVFLVLLGVAHGVFLFSGDVLSAYGVCGLLFLPLLAVRARTLLARARIFWILAGLSLFVPFLFTGTADPADARIPADASFTHLVYCEAGFLEEAAERWNDELWQQFASIPTFWPQALALFALGALAARLGWLVRPHRHARLWRNARRIGWGIGLPCALAGAALSLQRARVAPGADPGWDAVLLGAGSLFAAAYVAAVVRACDPRRGRPARAWRWLAAAGRMSLSNYLCQSLAMAALLCGWGLGLGTGAGRGALAAIALAIFVTQAALSRVWLAHFRQGPVEALWHRWTYG